MDHVKIHLSVLDIGSSLKVVYGSNIKFWKSYRNFLIKLTGHLAKNGNLTVIVERIYGLFR